MINLSKEIRIPTEVLNKHVLVAGATGTGKTVTLLRLIEELNREGIGYLMTDVKGDASAALQLPHSSAITMPQQPLMKLDPVVIAKLIGLNEVQTTALMVVFQVEPEIYTWKELKLIIEYLYYHPAAVADSGLVSKSTLGVILRQMIHVDETLAMELFKEDGSFRPLSLLGRNTVMDCRRLVESPDVYAAIVIGIIDSLYLGLPEVGDLDKPKLTLIIDEAHMLFTNAPKVLLRKLEQRVRLIRSKGVGIVFASQSPTDIPEVINAQISTRIQHGARIYTEKEYKKAVATAKGFGWTTWKSTLEELQALGTGEVLFRTLSPAGIPSKVITGKVDLPGYTLGDFTHLYK